MPSLFPAAVAAFMAGEAINASLLCEFAFTSGTIRVHPGFGTINAGGKVWSGVQELGSVSAIESAIGGSAPMVTFTLSGIDSTLIAKTLAAATEVKGRDVTIYLCFFDANWQPFDVPYAIWLGQMDVMRVKANVAERIIELTAETLFARRGLPPFGYLSDRDQQRLFSGDRGLEDVPAMAARTVTWPVT